MSEIVKSTKSFFDRPEGKTGLLFIFLGFVALIFGGNFIFPFIITALQNTLHAMFLIAAVVSITAVGLNRSFQVMVSNGFKNAMRFLTGLFIPIDPIGILQNRVDGMDNRLERIEDKMGKLSGKTRTAKETIEKSLDDINTYLKYAAAAEKRNNINETNKYSRMAAREKEVVDEFSATLLKMEQLYSLFSDLKSNLLILKEDTEHQVKVKKRKYEFVKDSHEIMSSSKKMLFGDKDEELYEQTIEFLDEDIGNKLGEIDRFFELSQGFMDTTELRKSVWNEEGMQLLHAWKNDSSIIDYEKNRSLPGTTVSVLSTSNNEPVSVKKSSFDSLF